MTTYELMFVAVNDKADQLLGRVEKFIKDANGEGVKVERLGKKQLAYQIKKQTDATYFVLNFQAEGEAVKPIWDKLRLEQEDLLRYLLIRKEEKKGKKKRKVVPSAVELDAASDDKQVSQEKPKVTVVTKSEPKAPHDISRGKQGVKVPKTKEKKAAKGTKVKNKSDKGKQGTKGNK